MRTLPHGVDHTLIQPDVGAAEGDALAEGKALAGAGAAALAEGGALAGNAGSAPAELAEGSDQPAGLGGAGRDRAGATLIASAAPGSEVSGASASGDTAVRGRSARCDRRR